MNTPKTDTVIAEIEKDIIGSISHAAPDVVVRHRLIGHARQLETQVQELREALAVLEQQLDYQQHDVALEYVRAILEKTK